MVIIIILLLLIQYDEFYDSFFPSDEYDELPSPPVVVQSSYREPPPPYSHDNTIIFEWADGFLTLRNNPPGTRVTLSSIHHKNETPVIYINRNYYYNILYLEIKNIDQARGFDFLSFIFSNHKTKPVSVQVLNFGNEIEIQPSQSGTCYYYPITKSITCDSSPTEVENEKDFLLRLSNLTNDNYDYFNQPQPY